MPRLDHRVTHMRKAQIENGLVTNMIEVDPANIPDWCEDWPESDEAGPGWTYVDGAFLPPAAPPLPVPQEVSRFQARAALLDAGLLAQADAVVAASGNALLQLAWTDAVSFKRNSPGIAALAPALGLDDAALDDLFRAAAEIVA